jgi:hypothetical protein
LAVTGSFRIGGATLLYNDPIFAVVLLPCFEIAIQTHTEDGPGTKDKEKDNSEDACPQQG